MKKLPAHYKTLLESGVSTNDLLLPVILIPICLLYVIVLCYLESEDTRYVQCVHFLTLYTFYIVTYNVYIAYLCMRVEHWRNIVK